MTTTVWHMLRLEPATDRQITATYLNTTLLLATCVVLCLVIFAQVPGHDLRAAELTNFAHGPAFALLTVLLFKLLRGRSTLQSSVLREYAVAVGTALALGAAVEIVQGILGRDASLEDLLRDAQGTLTATGFLIMIDPRLRGSAGHRRVQLGGLWLGLAGAAMIVWPAIGSGLAHLDRDRSFPTLADFDRPTSMHFVNPLGGATIQWTRLPPAFAGQVQGVRALRVEAAGRKWWGLMLREPQPDWRRYERVCVTIVNSARKPLPLELRVHDFAARDVPDARFTTKFEVPPLSRRTIRVPLADLTSSSVGTGIDLAHVRSLMLARGHVTRDTTEFYLTRLWLE